MVCMSVEMKASCKTFQSPQHAQQNSRQNSEAFRIPRRGRRYVNHIQPFWLIKGGAIMGSILLLFSLFGKCMHFVSEFGCDRVAHSIREKRRMLAICQLLPDVCQRPSCCRGRALGLRCPEVGDNKVASRTRCFEAGLHSAYTCVEQSDRTLAYLVGKLDRSNDSEDCQGHSYFTVRRDILE